MLAQAGPPQFAFSPVIMLAAIGLAMLVAVTIVIVSLAKAGKGASVAVALVILLPAGLILLGLLLPMIAYRRAAVHVQHAEAAERMQEMQMQQWDIAPPIQVHPELAPPQVAPPAPVVPPYEERNPEVISDEEMSVTADAASPSDQSSASPEEFATEPQPVAAELTSAPRPEWMKEALTPTRDFVERRVIHIERYSTIDELQAELPAHLRDAMNEFMAKNVDYSAPDLVKLPPGYVVDHGILADRWTEVHPAEEHSLGQPFYSLHVLLQFDKNVRNDLQVRYHQAKVGFRLGAFGVGGGLLLSLLATLYGYLKLDTLTKGFYTGRLRLAAGLTGASAATAAAALMAEGVVRWI
jgi:hypothetical protein